jgi:hypothetical protein
LSKIEFKAKQEQLEEEISNKQKSTVKESLEVDSVKEQGQSVNSIAEKSKREKIRLSNIIQKRRLKMKKHKLKKLRKRTKALRKRLGKI